MTSKIFTRYHSVLILALLAVSLLVTFGWCLRAPTFITHETSILRLPLLSWWKNLPLIFSRHFLMFSEGQFRPLSYGLLAVVRTFVRADRVLFWHIWLLAFHWLNAVLVFYLVKRFSRRPLTAALAGAIFGLHPLASVVVNNVNYFHYVFGLSFYLGVLLCYLSFAGTQRKKLYVAAVGLSILGVFTSKVVFTLPLILVAYEVLYRRSALHTAFIRMLPFVGIFLIISPLWWFYKPHPLYYKYIEFPPKAGWYSFFSVVGATGHYAKGLLLGLDIPVVLHEAVNRILRFPHPRFLLWTAVDIGILLAAGWLLRRKIWTGLGVLLGFFCMLPFVSTIWNGVEEYVSWAYLYFPTAGLAILTGGLADVLMRSPYRCFRIAWFVFWLIPLYYGVQQARINFASRSEVSYWKMVLQLNPKSQTASLELGKACLKRGEEDKALGLLFSSTVKQLREPCLVMTKYYTAEGDYLAAAVHLRMTSQEEHGLQFQRSDMARAKLFYAAGALDYAEATLGRVLMANPYNTAAMELLVEIWLLKGYVTAASRLINRASKLAPSDPEVAQMRRALEAYKSLAISNAPYVIHPLGPSWLRYAVQGISDTQLLQAIVRSSEDHPNDPVIQMIAGVHLVREGKYEGVLSKFDFATKSLPSCAHVWALKCWAATKIGAYSQAEEAGRCALELDPWNSTVHNALGILYSTLAGDLQDPAHRHKLRQAIRHYQLALQLDPSDAAIHSNLGNALERAGRFDRAIKHYRQAVKINPFLVGAHYSLGNLLARRGRFDRAIKHYRQTLRNRPDFAEAHVNLGVALLQQGELGEAIAHFRQALRLRPDYAKAHYNLGLALTRRGKLSKAIVYFRQALRLKPDYAEAYNDLGIVLMRQRRFGEAISVLRERVTRAPDDLGTTLNLAWLLATCPEMDLRDSAEAIRLAERVCRATGYRSPEALDVLAAAYAGAGRFDEAVQEAQQALQLAVLSGQIEFSKRIEERLRLYKAHQRYTPP